MAKVIRFAIVTTTKPRKKAGSSQLQPSYSFRMMAQEAQKLGIIPMIVHPDHFDWYSKTMTGWVGVAIGTSNEKWTRTTLPLPHVVYENVFVHLSTRGRTKKVRQNCRRLGIRLFNPGTGNKLSVNRALERYGSIRKYIPATRHVRSVEDVIQYLNQYGTVYLKPSGGYGGQGVTRIIKEQNDQYQVKVDRLGTRGVRFHQKMSKIELRKWVGRRLGTRHIVQQGLNLIKINDGQVDFRVVVQRTLHGEWKVIGIIPKIAAPGGVVTNIIAGGHKITLESLVDLAKKHNIRLPIESLETASIELAAIWSKRLPTLGVIGFDMGIDTKGNVWMIEMNPKPARSLLSIEMQKKSFRAVAEFAHYLTT